MIHIGNNDHRDLYIYTFFSTGSHTDCSSDLETTTVVLYLVSLKPVDSGLRYMACPCKTLVLTSKVKDLT